MSYRFREPEKQFVTGNGWAVARVRGRDTQHSYSVLYRGQNVGWVMHEHDGWRWLLTWSPGTPNRAPRFRLQRVSKTAYPT